MYKRFFSIFLPVILLVSLLAGCSSSSSKSSSAPAGDSKTAAKSLKGDIVIGGWPSGDKAFEAIIPEFNKKYPDIKIKLEFQKSADHHNKLLTSLAAGSGAPDVTMIEAGYVGKFRDKKGFVNLLDNPYNAKRYEKDFVDYKWQMAIALDGKQMIAIPWDIGPLSMFYRRDIFKAAGLPDDPAEVQKLVATWDGYLDTARKVSKPGERWMVTNAADIFMAKRANRDFYNQDLSFRFEDADSLKLLELCSTIRKEGLDAKVLISSNEFNALLKEGKVATHISGCWFGGFLKTFIAPESSGKWGVVRMPGSDTVTNWGGSFVGIPDQSKNKEAAWAFIEYAVATKDAQNAMFKAVDYFPAFKPAWDDPMYKDPDPFFGNQKTREFWVDVAKGTKPSFATIMDTQTQDIMRATVSTGLDQGLAPKDIIEKGKQEILKATDQDRKIMQDLIKNAKK